jgi:hypothetical protein
MRRNLDLVRSILQWMEDQPEGRNINWKIDIAGATSEEIGYHAHLMAQAGLITAADATALENHSPNAIPTSITWAGHEFLAASRDNTLWAKAKTHVIGPAAGATFSILLDWMKVEAARRLGLP